MSLKPSQKVLLSENHLSKAIMRIITPMEVGWGHEGSQQNTGDDSRRCRPALDLACDEWSELVMVIYLKDLSVCCDYKKHFSKMWLCSFHIISFFESPGKRRLIGCCLFVVRIHKTRWNQVALCFLLWGQGQDHSPDWVCSSMTHPWEGGRWWRAVLSRTRKVRRTEDSSHSHSALLLGVSSLPSISFWPRSQFPSPFLTTQAKLPEEERWVSNAKQNLFEPSSG